MKNIILILLVCLLGIGVYFTFFNSNNSILSTKEVQGTANNVVVSGSQNSPGIAPVKSSNTSENSF